MELTEKTAFYGRYNLFEIRKEGMRHDPVPHQRRALDRLGKWYCRSEQERGGILVLPTGGGKTFVATHFLCRHPLSDGYRILWLAHTHHLLEQAFEAFGHAMALVDEPAETARVRVVSGAIGHSRPAHIEADEDVLLCSLQTASRAFEKNHPRFIAFLRAATGGLFVVFDEAHHAPAPSYRRLLRGIRDRRTPYGLLGLTATPTYSNECKQGWLKQLFPQGIVAQEDAVTLMAAGVLARPIPENVHTTVEPEFDERDYQKWVSTHRDLPASIITSLAENRSRNDRIVAQYVNNRAKYGKTIMFADRWFQCDYLREALRKRGVRADAVYSHVVSVPGGAEVRNRRRIEDNAEVLKRFKDSELNVLINVQILTEGTDVPDAQTVFLTRQTTSEILLKQMVGRALRGPKFKGTDDAYIVSFIDKWQQHINWAAYDQIKGGRTADEDPVYGPRPPLQLVSIELVRRLARQMDSGLNINSAPYTAWLPVGWYQVEYDAAVRDDVVDTSDGGSDEAVPDSVESVRRPIMVYEGERERFERFLDRLQELHRRQDEDLRAFEHTDLELSETLDSRLIAWRDAVFDSDDDRPGGELTRHLRDLARHVAQQDGERPAFFLFDARKDHDLDAIASRCIDRDLGPRAVDDLLRVEYARRDLFWRVLHYQYDQFKSGYDACVNRILHARRHGSDPGDHRPNITTLQDLPEMEPSDETKWEVKVRDHHRCLCCGTDNGRRLEVDHVTPKYLHVDHQRENLQTLCRICNRQKGDEEVIDFRNHRTTLTESPDGFPDGPLPGGRNAKDPSQWTMYLQRSVNFFYRCGAVEGIDIATRGERFRTWRIWLFQGNDQDWLRPHLQELAERIRQARVEAGFQAAPETIVIAG